MSSCDPQVSDGRGALPVDDARPSRSFDVGETSRDVNRAGEDRRQRDCELRRAEAPRHVAVRPGFERHQDVATAGRARDHGGEALPHRGEREGSGHAGHFQIEEGKSEWARDAMLLKLRDRLVALHPAASPSRPVQAKDAGGEQATWLHPVSAEDYARDPTDLHFLRSIT